ncbi:appr-1-pase family/phage tail assembly-like protein [Ralstonia phage phiRSL1]|uniref:Appr-1-pase family/phage tail assembly-like protein n=1 Tax=Ralstonia phage phiRSL1 TaxID=1980924 RepID=B2ZXR9_9CAUD|nr:appr-1-pase family/phage tail assembly-like protein [Ralstonia phage phiRSL1]BAG41500.1 appr-1-pase family/phage tail assembly-like protein [Ralstonia phage phiRSL1]
MKVILFDTNPQVVAAWKLAFAGFSEVEIVQKDVRSVECDAVVSPANSFGIMTGGIDLVYREMFGRQVEDAAIERAVQHDGCAMPVGKAAVIVTNHERIPYMVMAPTMPNHRTPVPFTDNAYRAFRAALIAARYYRPKGQALIQTLACPGLCTASGGMYPTVAAFQMARAYKEEVDGRF